MKKNILKPIFLYFIFYNLFTTVLCAQTGKIAGKVTDADTREQLIGINVLIEGTVTGAASDIEGYYVINNIDPGVYTLIFSGVGYQKKIVTNVRVNTDFTTGIDAELSVEAIGLETIVVEAVRPLVRKDSYFFTYCN